MLNQWENHVSKIQHQPIFVAKLPQHWNRFAAELSLLGRYHKMMKLTCIHCGDSFSITASRLGMRGRCPHCLSPVQLPSSRDRSRSAPAIAAPRSRGVEHVLLAAGVLLVHVAGLLVMSQFSWHQQPAAAAQSEHEFHLPPPRPRFPDLDPSPSRPSSLLRDFVAQTAEQGAELGNLAPVTANPSGRFSSTASMLRDQRLGDDDSLAGNSIEFFSGVSLQFPNRYRLRVRNRVLQPVESFDRLLNRLANDGLDLAILIDSTASMDREIAQVKNGIQRISETLFRLVPKARISVCAFRDQGDQYIVKGLPLTDSIAQVITFIDDVEAQGGGDQSESVTAGLRWVLGNNRFRSDAKKVILIFGDAPPKPDQWSACRQLVADFRFTQQGVVSTVTCHRRKKLDAFVKIAQLGGGESFLNNDQTEIMQQLLVMVFGSRYRNEVLDIQSAFEKERALP